MNPEELKAMRVQAGLSQLDLERMTGIGRTYISLYENGRVAMSEDHQELLNITFAELFGVEPEDSQENQAITHEFQTLWNESRARLTEAPEGLLWGYDDEKREVIEQKVLTQVLRLLMILEESQGLAPFLPANNPKGSVGEALQKRLA